MVKLTVMLSEYRFMSLLFGTTVSVPVYGPTASPVGFAVTVSTAAPASSQAARSIVAVKPQSWSPAGSSKICRAVHLPGSSVMISSAGPRASGPVPS